MLQTGLPKELWQVYLALAVVPSATPLPMSMLRLLWQQDDSADAQSTASILNQVQILRLACLDDGSVWALVQPEHAQLLAVSLLLLQPAPAPPAERRDHRWHQHMRLTTGAAITSAQLATPAAAGLPSCRAPLSVATCCRAGCWAVQDHPQQDMATMHQNLIDAYLADAKVEDPAALPDDGYILQAIGHHLSFAGRLPQLKPLLMSPEWLEQKLHAYGRVAVVADFRRCSYAHAICHTICQPDSLTSPDACLHLQ